MDARDVSDLVAHGQVDTLVERLSGLNERQRKELVPGLRHLLDWRNKSSYPAWPLVLAALGCLGGERQVARALERIWGLDHVDGRAATVLRDRSPHWLPKLPAALLAAQNPHWPLVRVLVGEGVVDRPDVPEYLTGMVWGLLPVSAHQDRAITVRRALLDDPALLDHEVWRLLATERAGRQLAQTDGWLGQPPGQATGTNPDPRSERTWRYALVSFAAEGRIDRSRLLDMALAAPLRDWAPADVTWFIGLHDALEPTLDDVADRQATYFRLLTCEHGPAVKVAQRQLGRLVGDERLEATELLAAGEATLARTDKVTVTTQLTLLGRLAKRRPELARAVGSSVAVALDHPRADVRERARALQASLGVDEGGATTDGVAFVVPDPRPVPPPDPVTPVTDPESLAELLLRLVEEADDPIEMERAFDGVVRLAGQTAPTTRDALLRRLDQLQLWGSDPRADVARVAKAWLVRPTWRQRLGRSIAAAAPSAFDPPQGSLSWFHQHRMRELVRSASTRQPVSLALPTHADGSISAEVLAARLEGIGRQVPVGSADLGLALLRVPAAQLSVDLVPKRLRDSWVASSIVLLQSWPPQWERVRGTTRSRWGYGSSEPIVTFSSRGGPELDSGPVSHVTDRRQALAGAGWDRDLGAYENRFEQLVALWASYLPHQRDLLAAHLHPLLVADLKQDRGCSAPVMDALARSRPGPVECSALVLGLTAKDVRVRTAAQDALLELAGYGLLDGPGLGREATAHLADETVVGRRLAAGLSAVAAVDEAVLPVLDALEVLLPATDGRRDAAAFVELAADLAARAARRVAVPPHLAALATGGSTSLTAKAARRLV